MDIEKIKMEARAAINVIKTAESQINAATTKIDNAVSSLARAKQGTSRPEPDSAIGQLGQAKEKLREAVMLAESAIHLTHRYIATI